MSLCIQSSIAKKLYICDLDPYMVGISDPLAYNSTVPFNFGLSPHLVPTSEPSLESANALPNFGRYVWIYDYNKWASM